MQEEKTSDVIILGGGISGLSLGYFLKNLGISSIIIEKNSEVGGVISTKNHEDISLDTGPQSFLYEPEIITLIKQLNLEDKLIFPGYISKKRFLANPNSKNKILPFPSSPFSILSSKIFKFKDIVSVILEILKKHTPTSNSNISVYEILCDRFGKSLTNKVLAAPFVGIWATSIEKLNAKTATPELYKAYISGKSIIKSLINLSKKKKHLNSKIICSLQGGLKTLIKKLESNLTKQIQASKNLISCKLIDNTWHLKTDTGIYTTKHIVLSTPSDEIIKFLKLNDSHEDNQEILTRLINVLEKIEYSPIGILHVAVPKNEYPESLMGFGFLTSPFETQGLLGAIFTSLIFPNSNKEDVILTCFCGGSIKPEFSNVTKTEVELEIVAQLRDLLGIKNCKVIQKTYWERAIPIYDNNQNFFENLQQEFEDCYNNIHIHSNITKGVSIPSRVKQSMILAANLKRALKIV